MLRVDLIHLQTYLLLFLTLYSHAFLISLLLYFSLGLTLRELLAAISEKSEQPWQTAKLPTPYTLLFTKVYAMYKDEVVKLKWHLKYTQIRTRVPVVDVSLKISWCCITRSWDTTNTSFSCSQKITDQGPCLTSSDSSTNAQFTGTLLRRFSQFCRSRGEAAEGFLGKVRNIFHFILIAICCNQLWIEVYHKQTC